MTDRLPNASPTDSKTTISSAEGLLARTHVRYIGFEAIPEGRQLRFCVKTPGQSSTEVAFNVPYRMFNGIAGVSLQDAPLMAYEKLLGILAKEHSLLPTTIRLTAADIEAYVSRHDSQKSRSVRPRQTKIAA
jgi:hypothetical protein